MYIDPSAALKKRALSLFYIKSPQLVKNKSSSAKEEDQRPSSIRNINAIPSHANSH